MPSYANRILVQTGGIQGAAELSIQHSNPKASVEITLVHGTWARGIPLFAERFWPNRDAAWCKDKSSFGWRLRRDLSNSAIAYRTSAFNWSGANSIFVRDKAAHRLARLIQERSTTTADRDEVIIGHSHGGNIALRTLQILSDRGLERLPTVVTIATPFLHIETKDNRFHRVSTITLARIFWTLLAYIHLYDALLANQPFFVRWSLGALALLVMFVVSGSVIDLIASGTEASHDRIAMATKYRCQDDKANLLVVRGTEDEAGMALTLGLIGMRLSDIIIYALNWFSIFALSIIALLFVAGALAFVISGVSLWVFNSNITWISFLLYWPDIAPSLYDGIVVGALVMLGGMLAPGIFKAAFGRELFLRSTTLAVTANSVPDVACRITVRTLPRSTQGDALLLHSLYDHAGCTPTIAHWIRDMLTDRPNR